jgi:hypothetical protein
VLVLPLQDLRPFDQALQVAMAAIIHLELFVTVYAVSGLLHLTSGPHSSSKAQLMGTYMPHAWGLHDD